MSMRGDYVSIRKFLSNSRIKISNNGNISLNDIIDVFICDASIYNIKGLDNLEYYMSIRKLYKLWFKGLIGKSKRLDDFMCHLRTYDMFDLRRHSIYVVSTHVRAGKNVYKIGSWDHPIGKLITRYNTTLLNPIVYVFVKVCNHILIEQKLLEHFDDVRILNSSGNKSEWINADLNQITKIMNQFIAMYDTQKEIEYVSHETINNIIKFVDNLHMREDDIVLPFKDDSEDESILLGGDKFFKTLDKNYILCEEKRIPVIFTNDGEVL